MIVKAIQKGISLSLVVITGLIAFQEFLLKNHLLGIFFTLIFFSSLINFLNGTRQQNAPQNSQEGFQNKIDGFIDKNIAKLKGIRAEMEKAQEDMNEKKETEIKKKKIPLGVG